MNKIWCKIVEILKDFRIKKIRWSDFFAVEKIWHIRFFSHDFFTLEKSDIYQINIIDIYHLYRVMFNMTLCLHPALLCFYWLLTLCHFWRSVHFSALCGLLLDQFHPYKLASQIAAKRYQIQGWFVLTTYRNLPTLYPTVPLSTP